MKVDVRGGVNAGKEVHTDTTRKAVYIKKVGLGEGC
jgi:hypothetical protein